MSPEVHLLFRQILAGYAFSGPVMEVGAMDNADCLLRLPAFEHSIEKTGVNLTVQNNTGPIHFISQNANDLSCFKDNYFDAVVCNSMLEHDPLFWKTLAEIHRVTAKNGVVVIGVPGYAGMGLKQVFKKHNLLQKVMQIFARVYDKEALSASTLTLGEHFFPGDYYRFSEQAVREVFFAGFTDVKVYKTLNPPRFIGVGKKT